MKVKSGLHGQAANSKIKVGKRPQHPELRERASAGTNRPALASVDISGNVGLISKNTQGQLYGKRGVDTPTHISQEKVNHLGNVGKYVANLKDPKLIHNFRRMLGNFKSTKEGDTFDESAGLNEFVKNISNHISMHGNKPETAQQIAKLINFAGHEDVSHYIAHNPHIDVQNKFGEEKKAGTIVKNSSGRWIRSMAVKMENNSFKQIKETRVSLPSDVNTKIDFVPKTNEEITPQIQMDGGTRTAEILAKHKAEMHKNMQKWFK